MVASYSFHKTQFHDFGCITSIVRLVTESLYDISVAEIVGFIIINSRIDICLSESCDLFSFTTFLAISPTLSPTLVVFAIYFIILENHLHVNFESRD